MNKFWLIFCMGIFSIIATEGFGIIGGGSSTSKPKTSDLPYTKVVMDGFGNALASTIRNEKEIQLHYYIAYQGWQDAQTIYTSGTRIEDLDFTHSSHRALIAWEESRNIKALELEYDGQTALWNGSVQTVVDEVSDVLTPKVASTSNINFAAWRRLIESDSSLIPYISTWGLRFIAGENTATWTKSDKRLDDQPVLGIESFQSAFNLTLAANGNRAIAGWIKEDRSLEGNPKVVFVNRYNLTKWEGEFRLFGPEGVSATELAAGIDEEGNSFAVWLQEGNVYVSRFDVNTDTWGTVTNIENYDHIAVSLDLFVNEDGNAAVVWTSQLLGEREGVFVNRYNKNIGWATAQQIDASLEASDFVGGGSPKVAMDKEDQVRIVWSTDNVYTTNFKQSVGWSFSDSVGQGQYLDLAMDESGIGVAVWWEKTEGEWQFRERVWLPNEPIARFLVSVPITANNSINFDASSSTDDGTIVEYRWDFQSDGTIDVEGDEAAAAIVQHTYETPGVYVVTLAIEDDTGLTVEAEKTITVYPAMPQNLVAIAGDRSVTLSWDEVTGATSYNVYWNTSPNVSTQSANLISDITQPYQHTELSNGTTYYYLLTAVATVDLGISEVLLESKPFISNEVSATPITTSSDCVTVALHWTETETNKVITDDPDSRCQNDPGPYTSTYDFLPYNSCYLVMDPSQTPFLQGSITGNTAVLTGVNSPTGDPNDFDTLSTEKTLVFSDDGTSYTGTTEWTLTFAGPGQEYCSGTSELVGTGQ